MIYTVTFNPSLDYVVTVENFTMGRVNRTKEECILPGGKGLNVSMVLRNLGHESTAMGFLAGFTGERLQSLLEEKGIVTDFIMVKEGMSRINVKLCGGGETEINGQGPVIGQEDLRRFYAGLERLERGDILVLAGSIPRGCPSSVYMDIMRQLEHRGLRIAVDATGALLEHVLSWRPFLIKPNHHELGELFGTEIRSKNSAILYGRKLQERGARNVLISMGGDGAVLLSESGEVYAADAPAGTAVNSVGAGDSMVAGFLAGYLESGSMEEALRTGICAGSASAFSQTLATKPEVLTLLREHREKYPSLFCDSILSSEGSHKER